MIENMADTDPTTGSSHPGNLPDIINLFALLLTRDCKQITLL